MAYSNVSINGALIAEYWNNFFLNELRSNLVFDQLGLQNTHGKNQGVMVHWQGVYDLTAATTALTEGTDPTESRLTSYDITATVGQYGDFLKITDILQETWLPGSYEKTLETLARGAALTLDTVIRDSVFTAGGSAIYAGTAIARNSIATDGSFDMDISEVRQGVHALETLKVSRFPDGFYVAVIHQDSKYDLQGDTANWQDVLKYINARGAAENAVLRGEVGEMWGVRFILSQQALAMDASGSASTDVYQSYLMGADFYGKSNLQDVQTIIANPSPASALNLYGTVGYKFAFAAKQLSASKMMRIESGASFGT